jgi:hypothetical protein
MSRVRCAISTRKSSDDGLEREFNSLDAQYDSCKAYVLSQKHEGWSVSRERYDDGGYSGGSMERPGLKALLADIAAGKIDLVVIYKIDRLTRSLADFARIIEIMEKHGASFVSVTQSVNTKTSMGRCSSTSCSRSRSLSGRLALSGSETRSQHRRPKACGWVAQCRLATTPLIASWSSTKARHRQCEPSSAPSWSLAQSRRRCDGHKGSS